MFCHGRCLCAYPSIIQKSWTLPNLNVIVFAHTRIYRDVRVWEVGFSYTSVCTRSLSAYIRTWGFPSRVSGFQMMCMRLEQRFKLTHELGWSEHFYQVAWSITAIKLLLASPPCYLASYETWGIHCLLFVRRICNEWVVTQRSWCSSHNCQSSVNVMILNRGYFVQWS